MRTDNELREEQMRVRAVQMEGNGLNKEREPCSRTYCTPVVLRLFYNRGSQLLVPPMTPKCGRGENKKTDFHRRVLAGQPAAADRPGREPEQKLRGLDSLLIQLLIELGRDGVSGPEDRPSGCCLSTKTSMLPTFNMGT